MLDTATGAVSGVDTTSLAVGTGKWAGITAVGDTVYAAPFSAPMLLVLDTATGVKYGVSTEDIHSGGSKWVGITSVGDKLYAAPFDAPGVLVATVPVPSACSSTDASALSSAACTCGEDVCAADRSGRALALAVTI